MTDRQLSTRDLAARSDDSDSSPEIEQSADRTTGTKPTRDEGSFSSDEATTRDRSGDPLQTDARAADSSADASVGGGDAAASGQRELREPATPTDDAGREPLLPDDQTERFTTRWREIQTSFVDKPRDAVAEADALVADLMQRLAASFSNERERLEAQWDRGDDISTEELRVALTRYRSFFDRLLSA